jgi:hypothetical protein
MSRAAAPRHRCRRRRRGSAIPVAAAHGSRFPGGARAPARHAAGGAAFARLLLATALLLPAAAWAHPVSEGNAAFVSGAAGAFVGPFAYLGAKHMVTGLDHVLYVVGVVFLLFRLRDVLVAVSLFTLGHSTTLLAGVPLGWQVDAHAVDAVIGLSVVCKALENLWSLSAAPAGGVAVAGVPAVAAAAAGVTGAGRAPRDGGLTALRGAAIFAFGLVHGCGLATRLASLELSPDGLLVNLLSFNAGVEIGQFLVLAIVVGLLSLLRPLPRFGEAAAAVNVALLAAGCVLAVDQGVRFLRA